MILALNVKVYGQELILYANYTNIVPTSLLKAKRNEMNAPIIDPSTLTEEQKKKIKEIYEKTELDHCHVDEYNDWAVDNMLERLEALFGKEFFHEREMI